MDLKSYLNSKNPIIDYSSTSDGATSCATTPLTGSSKWWGGVLASNGKIYGIPHRSTSVLEIDPENRTTSTFGSSLGDFKYSGGVLAPNGKIYCVPYNASDVFLVPSLQENLSNSIMESMSCGLPVVAFDTGGNSDLIEHSINGYLAKKYETVDFANGIMELLNDEIREEYSSKARQFILDNFDYKIVANKYNDLYNYILNKDASE